MNSSGSALAENEKWLDSIEGKTYQFTNALQTMWNNFLDSEMIKGFIDFGTDVVKILDTGAGKAVAFAAAMKLLAKHKGFSLKGLAKGLGDNIKAITTAQQKLQALSSVTKVTGPLPTESVNAYAQAVAGLTAKQQANLLASQNLTKTDIQRVLQTNQCTEAEQREALAHVHTATTKQQETAASQALFVAKTQEMAATFRNNAMKLQGVAATEAAAAANLLEEASRKNLTRADLLEMVNKSKLTAATKQQIIAELGLTGAKKAGEAANYGLLASIEALYASNPVGWIMAIISAVVMLMQWLSSLSDKAEQAAEKVKQQAEEISQAYKDATEEIKSNLETLGATDEISIDSLEKEFATLAAGVDRYGNNLSLTSDQYERYKTLCEQMVGINPKIASGYDSATKAIGNNASALSELIELQKIQQRNVVKELISDENIGTLAGATASNIKTYKDDNPLPYGDAKYEFTSAFAKAAWDYDLSHGPQDNYDLFKALSPDGYMWTDYSGGGHDYTHAQNFASDFYDKIVEDLRSEDSKLKGYFTTEQINNLLEIADQYDKNLERYNNKINGFKDDFIDTLLQVPYGEEDYDRLNSDSKGFITEWIKNSEMFKIDPDATEAELEKQLEDNIKIIQELVQKLADENIQAAVNELENLDESSITAREHLDAVRNAAFSIWDAIGKENNTYGISSKEDIEKMLGVDAEVEAKKWSDAITSIQGYLGDKVDVAGQFNYQTMTRQQMNAFLGIPWDEIGKENINSIYDVWERINDVIEGCRDATQTYSTLSESVTSYEDILSQTSEIISDNTAVTQEYKDSLIELGVSEEELAECFDEANPLIVKNAKALNNLVKATSKNMANNVKLAKSQARLEYYDLVKQLSSALDGTKKLDSATRDSVYSTLEQIDAVQKALYQYQLLEDTLLGVNNAFKEFNEAKEIDDLNTYGDSYVEMVQTMYDGLFKTGKVGTEQFWAAVENLVPTEVYQGLKEDSDRMKAIYDYYNKKILPSLHLEEDQFSMDYASIENFVKKAIDAKVFTGDRKDFDLVEGMNLEEAAKRLEMTKTQAYAFFAELDKYNTSSTEPSFLSQLDDSLEGRITKVSNKIEDLNKQKLALLEDGGYDKNENAIKNIDKQIKEAGGDLESLGQEAYATWQNYTKNDAAIASIEEISDKSQTLSDVWPEELITSFGLTGEMTVEEAYNRLLQKQLKLEEPTILTAQLAIENIDIQIANLEAKLKEAEEDPTVLGVKVDASDTEVEAAKQKVQDQIQALQEDKVAIATTYNIELSEEDKETLQDELNAIEQFKINDKEFTVVAKGTSEVMRLLEAVNDYAKDVTKTVTTEYKTVYTSDNKQYSGWTHTPGSGGRYTHADGTAHATGSWGAPRTENALVGELGPELLVRNGRWYTIGENGAEFTQVQRGDIIFNHKQTEDLLSKGYVTGRGKLRGGSSAFASGTAYSGTWRPTSQNKEQSNKPGNDFTETGNRLFDAADSIGNAADLLSDSMSDAADEFREVFDWIEVRLEEINDDIELKSAQLENQVGYKAQNKVVDEMIDLNQKLYSNLTAGAAKYYSYADNLLTKVPAEYRKAAQDGSIAIEEFVGEVDEKTLEAIQEYREWVQKGDDAAKQAEETLTEISNLARQAIENVAQDYDNKASIPGGKQDQLDAYNALAEAKYGSESAQIYEEKIAINKTQTSTLAQKRNSMQAELDNKVQSGEIKKYSQAWYDSINDIAAVDTEILNLQADTENYQDAINDIHWEHFDNEIARIQSVSNEADNLIDILGDKDMVTDDGEWTDEGITTLGLYAQKMDAAETEAKRFEDEIAYLNKNWQALGYTEQEYLEKLDELKDGQHDAIKSYQDSKDAIIDLNKERIDAIKNGIEEEIDAYGELIEKKKEELDSEKDLYDFQKKVKESSKDIADIERQLAALAGDNSASARAKRAQLEAELAEAKQNQQDMYYERSIENQQKALDKEQENFTEAKEKEMEALDEYLEDEEQVAKDSTDLIQGNADVIAGTIADVEDTYGVDVSNAITDPWKDGANAISEYSDQFGDTQSATMDELDAMSEAYQKAKDKIEEFGDKSVDTVKDNYKRYQAATYQEPKKEEPSKDNNSSQTDSTIKVGGNINAGSAKIYDYIGAKAESQYYSKDPVYTVLSINGDWVQVRHKSIKSGVTGWFKKSDVKAYAKGSTGINKDQWALIDELGEELQLVPGNNGRLEYIKKGTGIVPADLTKRLIGIAMDPQGMLDSNRPTISPHQSIVNNNMEISVDASVGTLLHVDHLDGNNPEEVLKLVDKAWDKKMQGLNNAIKKFTR
jgi:hypothetical protein